MLPNKSLQGKRALYRQRHCLQGFVRTKALLASAKSPLKGHTDFGTKSSALRLARRGVGYSELLSADGVAASAFFRC